MTVLPIANSTFTGLTDTPAALTGQGGKYLQVNTGATALEFVDAPSGGGGGGLTVAKRWIAIFDADEGTIRK